MRVLRNWLRSWAAVDILVCGGGLVAALLYFRYWGQHQRNPDAWFDLWPNMATEILGAWLSVRVIDHLIRRREKRSGGRWRQARILMYWRDLARRIARSAYEHDLDYLADEVAFYNEPHNVAARRKYLNDAERADWAVVLTAAKELSEECAAHSELRRQEDALKWDDPDRQKATAALEQHKVILQAKAKVLVDAAEKARLNILEEEFEQE